MDENIVKRFLFLIVGLVCLWSLTGCREGEKAEGMVYFQGYANVREGQLYYQTFGSGKPVIVLHGGPLDQNYLLSPMLELAKDHQLVFYDQRGFGKSLDVKLDEKTMTMSQFVEDLELLRHQLGFETVTLIGHSWGGLLALNYAITYPDNVNALILINSAPITSQGFQASVDHYNRLIASEKDDLERIQNSSEFKDGDSKCVEDYYRMIFSHYFFKKEDLQKLSLQFTSKAIKSGFKVWNHLSEHYLAKFYDLRDDLKKISIPTLIIHGEQDPILLSTVYDTKQAIPNAKIIVFKECSHFSFIEKTDDLFNEIRVFLHRQERVS